MVFTERELAELKARDAQGRCPKCGTKIEMYSADADWCPKCRTQSSGRSAGLTDTESRLVKEVCRLQIENDQLKKLVDAVATSEFSGTEFRSVDGINWFDKRAELTGKPAHQHG